MAEIKLTKVAILSKEDPMTKTGGAHYHVFKNNKTGAEVIERTTAAYHALQKGPGGSLYNPTKDGHTWLYTFGDNEYDTPSGRLGDNMYAEDGDVAIVKTAGMPITLTSVVDKASVKSGMIDEATVVEAVNKFAGKEIATIIE